LHHYRGVNCLPEQIIIGAGTEYLLGLIIQLLGRKKVYAIENPGYPKTHKILKSHYTNIDFIGLDEDGLKVDDIARTNSNVVYITPSHHFPLGIIMPISRRMQLLKWANQSEDRFIIEDDYDSEFRFNGRPIPALQGLDVNEKVIYISTFSKSIAPSIRISYMVLPMPLLQRFSDEYSFYSSTVSRFEQYTLYRFIHGGHFERHLNRMRNVYRSRKDTLVEEIKKLPIGNKIEIIGENAGLHLLLKVHGGLAENDLITRAEKVGIKLYGLSEYYLAPDESMPNNVVVIGYSNYDKSEIAKAVNLLNAAWNEKEI
jgi:GntR family transcriptional regulator/MocR family aminotransferase